MLSLSSKNWPMFKHSDKCVFLLLALLFAGPAFAQNIATPAPDWAALFKRDAGWYGGDGIFTIPMGRDKTFFYFSDTMISDSAGGQAHRTMIHNSVAILQGHVPSKDKLQFYWDTSSTGQPQTPFIPKTADTKAG